jgi:hypothetical protein
MGDLLLLFFVQRLLLGKLLGALPFKIAVISALEPDGLILDVHDTIGYPVKEISVMGNQ